MATLTVNACAGAPDYNLCQVIDNKKDALFFYCENTDRTKDSYSIWAKKAAEENYIGMPLDDYASILKYAKQVAAELERCKDR